jgi:hypothetical protein
MRDTAGIAKMGSIVMVHRQLLSTERQLPEGTPETLRD